jgi:hypothetical protein
MLFIFLQTGVKLITFYKRSSSSYARHANIQIDAINKDRICSSSQVCAEMESEMRVVESMALRDYLASFWATSCFQIYPCNYCAKKDSWLLSWNVFLLFFYILFLRPKAKSDAPTASP